MRSSCPGEIDETSGDVRVDEFDAHMITDIEPFKATDDLTLRHGPRDSNPSTLIVGTRDDTVKMLTDATRQEKGRR